MNQMTITNRRAGAYHYVLLYLLVIMHGAVLWAAFMDEGYLGLLVAAAAVVVALFMYDIRVPIGFYFFCLATFLCYLLSALMSGIGFNDGFNIKTALMVDLNILLAYTIYQMDRRHAIGRFVKMVLFFAVTSLVFYGSSWIFGQAALNTLFTPVDYARGYHGYLLYSTSADNRNSGIFSEPGVYQVLLTSALLCVIYYGERTGFSQRGLRNAALVLVVTLLTTFSTTGYIGFVIILCGLLLKKKTALDKELLRIAVVPVGLLLVDYLVRNDESLLQTYVLNKVAELSDSQSSGGARVFVIQETLGALQTNPFFGVGARVLESSISQKYYSGFGTGNVLFSLVATKGLVTAAVTLGYILTTAFRNRVTWLQFLVFTGVFLNTIVAQTQIAYGALLLLAMIETGANRGAVPGPLGTTVLDDSLGKVGVA